MKPVLILFAAITLCFSACEATTFSTQDTSGSENNNTDTNQNSGNNQNGDNNTNTGQDTTDIEASIPITPIDYASLGSLTTPISSGTLSSPFGPRLLASEGNRYDFHRGLDIQADTGTAITSVFAGEIFRAYEDGNTTYPGGGNVVVTKHTPTQEITFEGQTITRFYMIYMHLDSLGEAAQAYIDSGEQRSITTEDTIGTVGDTGSASYPHLHIEARLQTTCSLESQLTDTAGTCTNYGFDPHINPMGFFSTGTTSDDLSINATNLTSSTVSINITAPNTTLNLDGINFEIFADEALGTLLYSKHLSFNTRHGFDASSTANLDNPETDGFSITPHSFNASSTSYTLDVEANVPEALWTGRSVLYFKATVFTVEGSGVAATGTL